MVTIFWDEDGVLIMDFLESGQTINNERYVTVLRKLKQAIKEASWPERHEYHSAP